MRYINIVKDNIPYRFSTQIDNETFDFQILYNSEYDFFTIDLSKDGEDIVVGDRLVYGKPLFSAYNHIRKPKVNIIPRAVGIEEDKITWDNLSRTVFLYLDRSDQDGTV